MPNTGKLDQLVEITVDDAVEKIVQMDTAGQRLKFAVEPGRFKQLAPDERKKLSKFGQYAYDIAFDIHKQLLDKDRAEEEEILNKINTGTALGSAKARLAIDGKVEGFEYTWIRPDMRGEWERDRGWKRVIGGPEITLSNSKGVGPHVITTGGSEELILMKRPIAMGKAAKRAKKNARMQKLRAVDDMGRAEVERTGVPSIGDDDAAGNKWRDRTGDE